MQAWLVEGWGRGRGGSEEEEVGRGMVVGGRQSTQQKGTHVSRQHKGMQE